MKQTTVAGKEEPVVVAGNPELTVIAGKDHDKAIAAHLVHGKEV